MVPTQSTFGTYQSLLHVVRVVNQVFEVYYYAMAWGYVLVNRSLNDLLLY